ncbi:hypothetical protein MBAV_000159 [Candidatus Magnetobacterium bavaricum]|uniref:Uncharacterized protein n=1 Tax=Candidatus Magnetobacterium bavaricum TaxID=29290 RepID=A0A0F3H0L9_9BACT|nr:hypothetical protein MBAV_000159 [Candidatus Magnetobacterium bavaricum]
MATVMELKKKQIERTKAYRERMKAKGMKPVLVYMSEAVIKGAGGSPQKLVDTYINNRVPGQPDLFINIESTTQPLQETQVKIDTRYDTFKETVDQLNSKVKEITEALAVLTANEKAPQAIEDTVLRQEIEGIKETIKLLEIKIDTIKDYTATEIAALKALMSTKVDKTKQTDQKAPQESTHTDKQPVGNLEKPKGKFNPAWFNEFNDRVNGGENLSLSKFAKEKGIDKGTLSKHFKKIREGRTA